jgi:hypothetical protein
LLASYITPFLRHACPDPTEASQAALAIVQSLGAENYPRLLAATRTICIGLSNLEMLAAIRKARPDNMKGRFLASATR